MKPILRLSNTECQSLQQVLREHGGARVIYALILLLLGAIEPKVAAEILGLGLSTLYDRMTRSVSVMAWSPPPLRSTASDGSAA